mgnify:CR=1 FL=1
MARRQKSDAERESDLHALISDCDEMLALDDATLVGIGHTREEVECARSGCVRDLLYLQNQADSIWA